MDWAYKKYSTCAVAIWQVEYFYFVHVYRVIQRKGVCADFIFKNLRPDPPVFDAPAEIPWDHRSLDGGTRRGSSNLDYGKIILPFCLAKSSYTALSSIDVPRYASFLRLVSENLFCAKRQVIFAQFLTSSRLPSSLPFSAGRSRK